jgi:hypothetical protein
MGAFVPLIQTAGIVAGALDQFSWHSGPDPNNPELGLLQSTFKA